MMLEHQVEQMERMAALLAAKTTDSLTPEQEQELKRLMEDDERCEQLRKMLGEKGFVEKELQAMRDIDSSKALADMQQRIATSEKQEKKSGRWIKGTVLRIAAAVLLLVAGGAYWYHREYTRVTPPEITDRVEMAMQQSKENGWNDAEIVSSEQASAKKQQPVISNEEKVLYHVDEDFAEQLEEASRVTTYHDKEYWIELNDGSLVHMNYDTHLIYPEKFGDRRDVIIDGEAYFMVAKDKSRQFMVHTPQGDVIVHGTEFYINTRVEKNQKKTAVVLVKGKVSFTSANGKETMMKPGTELTVTDGEMQQREIDVQPYQAWNEGEFVFADEPLESLLSTMGRWYHLDIEYANEDARQMRFTGTIDRYGSAEVILNSISKVTGLKIEQNGSRVVIR